MKIYTISDIHIDYTENYKWLSNLSQYDYQDDILILAGDITNIFPMLVKALEALKSRFFEVFYIPGNHDLWVLNNKKNDSFDKFNTIKQIADNYGIQMKPAAFGSLSIIPLFGWYDYSFGRLSENLLNSWSDFTACRWPPNFDNKNVTNYFIAMNEDNLKIKNDFIISFSHFMPRIDLMPCYIPLSKRIIYPVLGTSLLEKQVRTLGSQIHIYGHSHLNIQAVKDNTMYINNAFGYPHETRISAKKLISVFEL